MKIGNPNILIVDDDPFVLELLSFLLESEGYSVSTALNGVDALKSFRAEEKFDLVISDLNMPEMNGNELAMALKAISPTVSIVLLSGNRNESSQPSVDAWVLKDEFLQDTLLNAVEQLMHSRGL